VGGKARVHELAKELGVTAKEVLARLSEHGEFVKSASSTVEGPVARRLREEYQAKNPAGGRRGADGRSPASAKPFTTSPVRPTVSRTAVSPAAPRRLTPSQAASVCKRFRQASASGQDQAAINQLYLEGEAQYGVSRETLQAAVAKDLNRNPGEYVAKRQSRKGAGEVSRPRPRTGSLQPDVDAANTEGVVDLIVNIDASQDDRDEVRVSVQDFIPNDARGYGYLAWRYSAAHHRMHPDLSSRTAHHDLAVMAHVVDTEKQLVDHIILAHGPVLEQPGLAKRVLEAEFSDLTDVDDIGRSAADELRRVRARSDFLQLAVVLAIASPDCDQRLWDMLDRIRPPAPDQLVETSTSLESAIARLNELIAHVETLLTADEATLGQFFRQAHTELVALHTGRYDFLQQFHYIASAVKTPRRADYGLPFAVLPRGEQLRTFLDGLRSSGRYRGRQVDEQRVTVLEDIEKHFGADRCEWHERAASSSGFDNHYVVLTIKSANDSGDHAVAISPLAGEHATYVVRSDCAKANWMTVLAQSKPEAREQGALKFLFTGTDPYSGMCAKVVDALECPPQEFLKRTAAAQNSRRDRQS
jgi:Translation initiation factor IF-2, N-terminal region